MKWEIVEVVGTGDNQKEVLLGDKQFDTEDEAGQFAANIRGKDWTKKIDVRPADGAQRPKTDHAAVLQPMMQPVLAPPPMNVVGPLSVETTAKSDSKK